MKEKKQCFVCGISWREHKFVFLSYFNTQSSVLWPHKGTENQIRASASHSQVLGCNWKYLYRAWCQVNRTQNSSSSTSSTCPSFFSSLVACYNCFIKSKSSSCSATCKSICGLWYKRDYAAHLSRVVICHVIAHHCWDLVFMSQGYLFLKWSCSKRAGSALFHITLFQVTAIQRARCDKTLIETTKETAFPQMQENPTAF